jgi:hypothetical protein
LTVAPVAEFEKHDKIGVIALQLVELQHAAVVDGVHDDELFCF